MSIFQGSNSPWTGRMLSVLRIVAGLMFITFGTMKLFDYPPDPVPGMTPVDVLSQMGAGGSNGGVPAVLYCLFFLYLVFAGAGEWSIDAIVAGQARPATIQNEHTVKRGSP